MLYNYFWSYTTVDDSSTPPDTVDNVDSVDVHNISVYNERSSGVSIRFLRSGGALSLSGGLDWLSGSLRATAEDESVGTNIIGPRAQYGYDFRIYDFWSGRQNQFDLWVNSGIQPGRMVWFDLSGRLQFVKNRRMQPSYNLGVVCRPYSQTTVKLGYAYAFRLPSIADQFADGFYITGRSQLHPETARTLLLTFGLVPANGNIKGEMTLFHQRIDSLIQYAYDLELACWAPRNVDRFRSTGIDVHVNCRVNRILQAQLGGVWQKARQSVTDADTLVAAYYVPDIKWRFELVSTLSRFSGSLNVIYTSDRTITYTYSGRKDIARVYEFGSNVTVSVSRHLLFIISGLDLTDQRRPDQFGYSITDGDYPGPGRRVIVEARLTLK